MHAPSVPSRDTRRDTPGAPSVAPASSGSADASQASANRPATLRSVDDTIAHLLAQVVPVAEVEEVVLRHARTRVLAHALCSALDVPAGDNAQMDGYAVCAAALAGAGEQAPVTLPVSQRVAAGHAPSALADGSVARIFTGAWIPDGADAVVMQEDVVVDARGATFRRPPADGAWIRRRGEDVRNGQVVIEAGTRLAPQHLGLAASIGAAVLPVVRRPRIAIFSTGDELALPGEVAPEDLRPGQLYNSNRYTLAALVEALGGEVIDLGVVPDTLAATRAALREAAAASDCIVTSGGVSVGEEDHVRPAVEAEGRIDLWAIDIKPGKPFAFGRVGDAHFVGLPGNPVSGFVTFLVLVRPLLLRLAGRRDVEPTVLDAVAGFDWPRPDRRREFLRVRRDAAGTLELFRKQGSAVLTSTVWGDGLVDNPGGHAIGRGDRVRYLPFAALIAD